MIMEFIPLLVLYEFSIVLARVCGAEGRSRKTISMRYRVPDRIRTLA